MVAKRKAKERTDTIEEDDIDDLPEEEEGDGYFAGFPDENLECKVFKMVNRQEAYIGTVSTPVTIEDIKENYGPGTFVLYVRKDNKIFRKKKIYIYDERGQELPTVAPVVATAPAPGILNGIDGLKDIIEVVGKLTENKNTASDQMAKMMEIQMTMVSTLQASMMQSMNGQMDMMNKMREFTNETGGKDKLGAITDIVKEVSKTAVEYMKFRGSMKPAVKPIQSKPGPDVSIIQAEPVQPSNDLAKVSIVDILNDMALKDDRDFDFVVGYMEKFYPDLLVAVDTYDFEVLFPQLVTMGLLEEKKDYFNELYQSIRTPVGNDTERPGYDRDNKHGQIIDFPEEPVQGRPEPPAILVKPDTE